MNIDLSNKAILVTGGAGFIGSNLCEVLLEKDNKVVCLEEKTIFSIFPMFWKSWPHLKILKGNPQRNLEGFLKEILKESLQKSVRMRPVRESTDL